MADTTSDCVRKIRWSSTSCPLWNPANMYYVREEKRNLFIFSFNTAWWWLHAAWSLYLHYTASFFSVFMSILSAWHLLKHSSESWAKLSVVLCSFYWASYLCSALAIQEQPVILQRLFLLCSDWDYVRFLSLSLSASLSTVKTSTSKAFARPQFFSWLCASVFVDRDDFIVPEHWLPGHILIELSELNHKVSWVRGVCLAGCHSSRTPNLSLAICLSF